MFNNSRLKNRPPDYIFFLNKIYGVLDNMMANYRQRDKIGVWTETDALNFSQSPHITKVAETLKSISLFLAYDKLRHSFGLSFNKSNNSFFVSAFSLSFDITKFFVF